MSDRVPLPQPDVVTVYGADWCADCHRTKRWLETTATPFRWIDLARDREAQRQLDAAGFRAIPVVVTPGGDVLVEPSDAELVAAVGGAS